MRVLEEKINVYVSGEKERQMRALKSEQKKDEKLL